MQSSKQCALPATTMTIWQIKPSAHDVPLQLLTQHFPVSSFQISLRYKCLLDAGIRRKPFDKM